MGRSEQPPGSSGTPERAPKFRRGREAVPNWNLFIALHRFFTFRLLCPDQFSFDPCILLAELGLYYDNEQKSLRCNFCDYISSLEEFKQKLRDGTDPRATIARDMQENFNCNIAAGDSKNVPMPDADKCENFKFESHRLYSLLKYRDWSHVEPLDLARSGFYYIGKDDKVRCAFCNLEVNGWEEGDTADGEHKRWNPNCPFLKGASLLNVKIGNEPIKSSHDGIGKMSKSALPFPSFARVEHRLKTFENAPHPWHLDNPTVSDLVNAGFYLKRDRTVCYCCEFEKLLINWRLGDVPANGENHRERCAHKP
ncbi:death-associated inhibitor of apoptosis 2-like [Cloeon dipterum]|uniref:death-associated inhibitor of apoptosis 2-like n=1 Tax=Cloeon dipterum TaxID=197152 RepID=UPI00321F7F8C